MTKIQGDSGSMYATYTNCIVLEKAPNQPKLFLKMSTTTPFFRTPQNLDLLRRSATALRHYSKDHGEHTVANFLTHIIESIISNPGLFDEYSPFNIEKEGQEFINILLSMPTLGPSQMPTAISGIFCCAFGFLLEVNFRRPTESSFQTDVVEDFVDSHLDQFTDADKRKLIHARYRMPVQIAKNILNDPGMRELQSFSQNVEKAKTLKSEWDKEISQQQTYVEALKKSLNDLTTDYNFVGLIHGFKKLSTEKLKERKYAFNSLLFLAILMLIPPIIQMYHVFLGTETFTKNKEILLYALPAIITTELILIYFFRVALGHFRSVKIQLLQIDLRIALCQFVQKYAEYASEVKANDKDILEKFESIVFSSIVTEGDSIPSTFDGTEKIAQLVKSFRGA